MKQSFSQMPGETQIICSFLLFLMLELRQGDNHASILVNCPTLTGARQARSVSSHINNESIGLGYNEVLIWYLATLEIAF